MDRATKRKVLLAVLLILLGLSVFTLVARALGWYTGFHFPFLFLFIPFMFPLLGGSDERREYDGTARYCPECGSPTEEGAEFCRYCGRKL